MNEKTLIKRALVSLKIDWDTEDECSIKKINEYLNDAQQTLNDNLSNIQELADLISELKDLVPQLENTIETYKLILHQIDVEEYKELNKGKDVQIF